ncbi:MAG TPA: hypothetical protein VIJ35_04960 [Bradyrhizobium sp.]|jgi:hypothetical protein
MNIYSIIRVGGAYAVQADEKSILKIASRRRAAQLVTDAAELLDLQAAAQLSRQADVEPSIARDPGIIPDPREVP